MKSDEMAEKCVKLENKSLNLIFYDKELLICLVCKININANLSFDHDALLSDHLNCKKHQKNVRALFKLCVPNWSGSYAEIIQSLVFDVSLERNESSFICNTDNNFVCLVCQETIAQGTNSNEIITSIIKHLDTDFHLINFKDGVCWIYPVDDAIAFIMFRQSEVHCNICRQNLDSVITCPMKRAMDHLKVDHSVVYKILYQQQNKHFLSSEKSSDTALPCENSSLSDRDTEMLPSAKSSSTILKRTSLTLDKMADEFVKVGNKSLNYIFDDKELLICLVCKININANLSFDHDALLSDHLNCKKHQKNVRGLFKLCVPNWSGSYAEIIQSLIFDVSLERNESSFVCKTDNNFVCLVCQETIAQGTHSNEIITSIIKHIETDFHLNNFKDGVCWIYPMDHLVAFIMFCQSEVHCNICRQNLDSVITCPMTRAMDHLKVDHSVVYKILYQQQNKHFLSSEKSSDTALPCANSSLSDRDSELLPSAKSSSTILKRTSLTLDKMADEFVKVGNKSLNYIFYDNELLICLVCKININENLSFDHDFLVSKHLNSEKHKKNFRALFKLCVPNWSGGHAQIVQRLVFDVSSERNESSFVSKADKNFVCLVCQETIAQGKNSKEMVKSLVKHIETDCHLTNFKDCVTWIHPLNHNVAFSMFHQSEVHCSICRQNLESVITCPLTRAMDHLKAHHSVVYKILNQLQNKDSFIIEKSVCQAMECLMLTDETLPSAKSSFSDKNTELSPSAKISSSDRDTELLVSAKSSSSDKNTELSPSAKISFSDRNTELSPSAKISSSDRGTELSPSAKSSFSDRNTELSPSAKSSSSGRDTELSLSAKSNSSDEDEELSFDTFDFDADELEDLVDFDYCGESSNESIDISVDDLICSECGEFIEIYNENADFSMDLHLQKHKPLTSANTESDFDYQDNADYVCPICQETIQIFNGNLELSIDRHFEEERYEHERFTLADCGDKNRFDFLSRVFDQLPHDVRDQKSVFVMDGNEVFCKLCSCTVSSSKHIPDACKVFSDHMLSTFHVDQLKASSQFLAMAVLNYNKQIFPPEDTKEQDNVFKNLCKQHPVIRSNIQFIEKRNIHYYCTVCSKHICHSPKEIIQTLNFVYHLNGKLHKQSLKQLKKKKKISKQPVDYRSNSKKEVVSEKKAEVNNSILKLSKQYPAVYLNQSFITENNGDFFCELCQVEIKLSKTGTGSDLRNHCAATFHNTELSARFLLYLSQLDHTKLKRKHKSALSKFTKYLYFKPHTHLINHNGEDFCCIICNMPIPGSKHTGTNLQRHFFTSKHRSKCFEITCDPDYSPVQLKSKKTTVPATSTNANQKSVNTTPKTEASQKRANKKFKNLAIYSPIIKNNFGHIETRNGGFFCKKCKEHISCNSSGSHLIEHFKLKQH